MNEIFNDFGFTTVTENELDVVTKATTEVNSVQEQNEELKKRLDSLYEAIGPLLTNLKANPEKNYIYWPERVKKVDSFSAMLKQIYEGSNI